MSQGKFPSYIRASAFLSLFLLVFGAISFAFPGAVFPVGAQAGAPTENEKKPLAKPWLKKADSLTKPQNFGKSLLGGDSERLIYGSGSVQYFPSLNGNIYSVEPVGGATPEMMTIGDDIEPSFSPDGKKIVFISHRNGVDNDNTVELTNREIYIMNADGTDQRRLTFNNEPEAQPVFSPDGTKILFVGISGPDSFGSSAVYTMNLDGSGRTMLFDDSCAYSGRKIAAETRRKKTRKTDSYFPGIIGLDTPNYSPDGTKIVFGYGSDVFEFDVANGGCVYLTGSKNDTATEPRYSPDGTKIAFVDREELYDPDTGNYAYRKFLRIVSSDGYNLDRYYPLQFESTPVWSPDGSKFAYFGGSGGFFGADSVWTFDPETYSAAQITAPAEVHYFSGLSWNTPSSAQLPLSLVIMPNPQIQGGQSGQGLIDINLPGGNLPEGRTINLSVVGEAGVITLASPTLHIPQGWGGGIFDFTVAPSAAFKSVDIIAEYNGHIARATVSVRPGGTPKPDLRAVGFTAPDAISAQTSLPLSWTVENISPVATPNFYIDAVYFSLDDQLDAGDETLITRNQSSLGAGQQRSGSATSLISYNRVPQSGRYYLIFRTNDGPLFDEGGNYANNTIVRPIQVNLPDVVAENIVVPTEVEPGVNFNFSYTVRNQGAAGTPTNDTFYNKFYFSEDNLAGNADDVLLDQYFQAPLAAGESAVRTVNNAKIPTVPVRADGQKFFYVVIDYEQRVREGSDGGAGESNNTTFRAVQFFYRVPDLQVAATGAPSEVDSDAGFPLEWTTANAGNRRAAAFADKIYFSLDDQVGGDVEIGSFPLAAGIDAGASAARIQNVMIPTGALTQTGNYFVYVKTDAATAIDEGVNENNNVRFQPVRVRRLLRPDLQVTNVTAPNAAFFDQTIQVQWTVTNAGQGPTNTPQWRDRVFLFSAQTTSWDYQVATSTSVSALNAGESYTASATFKVPRGYNGSYLFTVQTDSDDALNEENTANNTLTRAIQINVPPLPDLIVENVQVPLADAFAGQELAVGYTIKNQGAAAAGAWRDRVYLSRDAVFNPGEDRLIFSGDGYASGGLAANASRALTTRTRIPGTYLPEQYNTMRLPTDVSGLWYVFVLTDYRNDVYEFNDENNNFNYDRAQPGAPLNILVTPPDLVVPSAPQTPDSASSGQSIATNFAVKNQGAFGAAANLYHGVYLSTDQTFDADDTLLGSVKDPDFFQPAGEHALALNVRLPNCLADGTYYLLAVADFRKEQYEFDPNLDAETNNASPAKQIQITTLPTDLIATNLQFSPPTAPGQTISVQWTVANAGSGAASGSWQDRLVLNSTNPEIPPIALASVEHSGGLAAGTSYTKNAAVNLPAYMEGAYFIAVNTDYNNSLPECGASETNNALNSSNFSVQNNLPDLVIDSVDVPSTVTAGEDFTVQWTGRNANGAMAANSPKWTDAVYLSTDQTLSNDDYLLGRSLNDSILTGGASYPQQAMLKAGNIPVGNYYVLISADDGRHVYEGAKNTAPETNNVRASGRIALAAPAVDLQVENVAVAAPHYSGASLAISWTVTNYGATETLGAGWSDYVILSRDLILDASDTILGYRLRDAALAGGASYAAAGSFYVPNGLTGDYHVFVVADYANRIIESNNANNTSAPFTLDLTLTPPADLNVTNVAPPATVNPGEHASFNWTVQNSGPNDVLGKWRDAVYLSRDTFWDSGDALVGQREFDSRTTAVPAGGTYTTGTGVVVPPVEEGTYYVIVRTDAQNRIRENNEANNVSAATAITTVTIAELQLNTPYNTTLGNGALKYLKFTPQPLETILLSLTTDKPTRSNELLTNFGSIVSRSDFDFQGVRPGEGNQENLIPETGEGPYYTLVRTDHIPESFAGNFEKTPVEAGAVKTNGVNPPLPDQNITVNAQIIPFSVRKVSPTEAGNEGFATLIVEGAKFQTGASVRLAGANDAQILPVQAKNTSTKIAAVFDLKGKPAGDYTVVVTNPDNQTTALNNGFKIVQGGGHSLRTSVLGPGAVYTPVPSRQRFTVSASNDGINDALNVPLIIDVPKYNYTLDPRNLIEAPGNPAILNAPSPLPMHFDVDDRRIIFLMIPILKSKTSLEFGIDINYQPGGGYQVRAGVLPPLAELLTAGFEQLPATAESNGLNLAPTISREAYCWAELTRAIGFFLIKELFGIFSDAGECTKALVGMALNAADVITGTALTAMSGSGPDAVGVGLAAVGKILDLVATAKTAAGLAHCAETVLETSVPWFKVLSLGISLYQLIKQYYDCLQFVEWEVAGVSSFDPNEKIGPEGFGAERFVPAGQPMLYRINFENLATATAPAKRVFISDQLPPTLDPRTVRLKEIGFKQNTFVVDDNRAFYQNRVQLGADLNGLQADIVAGLDLVNRRITWTITAIDPQTGDQPADPLVGILPPNNANADGTGYVTFTIEPTANAATRTAISNAATIVFDENEPIDTNATVNLLDADKPSSQIAAVPPASGSPNIALNISGADAADGSGLKDYDVLYSENGGAYLPLVINTNETSVTFNGKWGKTYRFYSVASDNAGNVELPPAAPDATVTVLGSDTEGDVAPRPNGNDGQVSVGDVTQIRRFAAGLDADFLYNEFQRADTSPLDTGGDGGISTSDVIQARRFAAGLDQRRDAVGPNEGAAPGVKTAAGKSSLALPREVRPVMIARTGNKITVGVELEAQGDEVGVGFTLNFDPSVLSNPANVALGNGAGGAALTVNNNQAAAGRLGIIVDRAPTDPFAAGVRQLVTVTFDVVQTNAATANFSFGNSPVFREVADGAANPLSTVFSSRSLSLVAPTAAAVEIKGRVLSSPNAPLEQAIVVLTDSNGNSRTAKTNSFGYFRFAQIEAGGIYTVSVSARRYEFTPQVLNVSDSIADLILMANPK
ncbi:MAG TPA: CARDB domain-containing protein [Pyrinomonadaceae bacterium]|jgi:subtilase family serine protease/Tol biopolymer transport system component